MADQTQENYEAYTREYMEDMERDHFGKFALMHDGEIVYVFNNLDDAYMIGTKQYGLGSFSIVEIGQKPINLSRRALGFCAA